MAQITSGSLTIVDVTDGAAGLNNTTVFLYRRATSAPNKPTGNLTYTFATALISGDLEGWKQSISDLANSNDPIWMIAAVASSNGKTDVIESSEWAGPIKMAQNGQDGQPGAPGTNGLNQATVFIYKRDDSATAPSNTTYTFATGGFTAPSGWSKTIPTEPKGKPCWVTSAVAIGAEATTELNWVTPSVLVEDGSDGVSPTVTATETGVKIVDADGNETFITNGADGTTYYTFVRYSENADGSEYVVTPTSETVYIGIYTGIKSSPPAYNDSGWTWSKYVGADGQPGTPGAPGIQGPQGVSVTATRELYYLKTNSTDPAQITNANQIHTTDDVNQWTSIVPTYIGSGKYYTCIETTLSNGNIVWSAPVENKGLTDANVNAVNAIEIAKGVKQHFFWVATDKSEGVPAGAYVAEESEESFYSNPTKGNILTRSDGIWIRNGIDKLATLQGSGLTFLVPTGTYKGQKSVSLNGSGLTFYNIGSNNSAAATLASDGLQITNGSIVLGTTSGTDAGNVTLSNKNFTRSINETSHNDLRFAIGSKFGVASDGTLYASGANIQGQITVSAGSNIYTKDEVDDAIGDTATDLANYILSNDKTIDELEKQIDGAIDTWYYNVDPTTSNEPAKDWTTETLKESHLRDLYFNTSNGHTFRWAKENNTYKWIQIEDADAIKALADAAAAQSTANVKRRVFVSQPTPPYDIGDLWVEGSNGDIKKCKVAKTSAQSYAASDWELASKYTDDSSLNDFVTTTYSTNLRQTNEAIELRATKTEVSNAIDKEVTDRNAAIQVSADSITQEVSTNYTKTSDLANTEAVKAAKKAGDDAQADLDEYKGTVSETYATKSSLTQTAEGIRSDVSATYATKTSVPTKVSQLTNDQNYATTTQAQGYADTAEDNAKADTTEKLKSYSTTTQMNSAINQKADSITSTVSSTYETKTDASEKLTEAKDDATTKAKKALTDAKADTTNKLKSYYTKTETDSAITQKANEISLSVAQTEISKIEVGGRNYIKDSRDIPLRNKATGNSDYYTLTVYHNDTAFEIGDVLTASANVEVLEGSVSSIDFYLYGKSPETSRSKSSTVVADIVNGKAVAQLTLNNHYGGDGNKDFNLLIYQGEHDHTAGNHIKLTNVKLEKGNKATDWSPAPEDVDGRIDTLETFKSEFTVTPQAISSEVQATQDGATLVSRINQTADTVKIEAEHIEIDGTAIFNAIKTQSDAAYDAKGAAQTAVDGIEVGGRNLYIIRNSKAGYLKADSTDLGGQNATRKEFTSDYIPVNPNENVIFQNWVTPTKASGEYLWIAYQFYDSNKALVGSRQSKNKGANTGTLQHDYYSIMVPSGAAYLRVSARMYDDGLIKVEKGNKTTDWTPAPEDVQVEIDAKKSVHTLIAYNGATATTQYTATYAQILGWAEEGKTNLNAWVTSIDGIKVGDTVRLAFLVSDMNNATVYIVGEVASLQETTGKPLIKFNSHGLDTTVINGGNILTNSIGANQIAANAITSDELAANSVVAGKIATGAVTADKIAANSITANKLRMADYNNYVTVTENDESSLLPNGGITITDGWCYKTSATGSNVGVSAIKANWTKTGEKYRVTGIAKAPAAGAVRIYVNGRNADGSWVIGNYCETALAADTETAISGIITVSSALEACAKCNIAVRFYSDSSGSSGTTYQVGYFKQLRVERMSGAELIVDGSITADKLAANAITIGKIASNTQSQILNSEIEVGGRNLLLATPTRERTTEYHVYSIPTTIPLTDFKVGDKITVQLWDIVVDSNSTAVRVFWGGGNIPLNTAATGVPDDNGYLSFTYTVTAAHLADSTATNQFIRIYNAPSGHSDMNLTVGKWKLERGNKATDWTPAPEDVDAVIASSDTNMLLDWDAASLSKVKSVANRAISSPDKTSSQVFFEVSDPPERSITHGIRISLTTASSTAVQTALTFYEGNDTTALPLQSGTSYTLSCWARCTSGSGRAKLYYRENTSAVAITSAIELSSTWQRVYGVFTPSVVAVGRVFFYANFNANTTGIVEMCGFKCVANADSMEASNYITSIGSDGIRIHAKDNSSANYTQIDANGMDIRRAGTSLAAFTADGMRVGKSSEKHIEIKSDQFSVYDDDGSKQFSVSTEDSVHTVTRGTYTKIGGTSQSALASSAATQIYLRGLLSDNRVYFGVSSSTTPTDFSSYIEDPPTDGTSKLVTVDGVRCYAKYLKDDILNVIWTNTTTVTKNVACKITETYRETNIKVGDAALNLQSIVPGIIDTTGTAMFNGHTYISTYGHIATLRLAVYNSSSIINGGIIYKGTLVEYLPHTTVTLSGYQGADKIFIGRLDSDGSIIVQNRTGSSISINSSSPIYLTATYIFK